MLLAVLENGLFGRMKMSKTHLRELSSDMLRTAYYDTILYNRIITAALSNVGRNRVVADIGCGDGRFTKLLLNLGFQNILAIDIERENLQRLESTILDVDKGKVAFINKDIRDLYMEPGDIDVVIAIEALYYLNDDFEGGCSIVHSLLTRGGLFINAEPTFEGSLLQSLNRRDIKNFVKTVKTKREQSPGNSYLETRVFDDGEVEEILSNTGFAVEEKKGISLFPAIILSEEKKAVRDILIELSLNQQPPFRTVCFVSRKERK